MLDDKIMTRTTCRRYILSQAKKLNHAFTYSDLSGQFAYGTLRNEVVKLRKKGEIIKLPEECPARFIVKEWANRAEYKRWIQSDKTAMRGKVYRHGCELRVDFASFIESLDWGELAHVHDIRVEFDAVRVDGVCTADGWDWSPRSYSWKRRFEDFEFPLTVQLYDTGRVQVVITCSLKPIPFKLEGLTRLTSVLGELKGRLGWSDVPNVADWVVTSWHYGKDSLKEVSGVSLNVTFETWFKTLARIYYKAELRKVRVETVQSPRRSIKDIFENVLSREGGTR